MDKRIKSQAAIEFAVLISGVFLVFLIFLKIIAGQYVDIGQEKAYSSLKDLIIDLFVNVKRVDKKIHGEKNMLYLRLPYIREIERNLNM